MACKEHHSQNYIQNIGSILLFLKYFIEIKTYEALKFHTSENNIVAEVFSLFATDIQEVVCAAWPSKM